jgi:cobyrinic acid a,c-diamide synthase
MREAIGKAIAGGMPTYAECGGLTYLSRNFVGTGVRAWEMVGAIPGEVRMEPGVRRFGYATVTAERSTFLVEKGEAIRGHEFRTSAWTADGGDASVYRVTPAGRDESRLEGFGGDHLHASRVHLHFASAPRLPGRFVKAAAEFAKASRRKRV